ncbi:MAG: universal stress protein [Euryarchaeota archaeon]|nr:universal stress protein [Euryarchaeota archaeon]
MFKKILLATNGSETSKKAEEYAINLAKMSNGQLTALYVVDIPQWEDRIGSDWQSSSKAREQFLSYVNEESQKEANQILKNFKTKAEKEGILAEIKFRAGTPYKEIIREARDNNFDVIILGSRRLKGLAKMWSDKIAEKVIREAPCSVIVIR